MVPAKLFHGNPLGYLDRYNPLFEFATMLCGPTTFIAGGKNAY
jgi:hypothetical protein